MGILTLAQAQRLAHEHFEYAVSDNRKGFGKDEVVFWELPKDELQRD